MNFVIVRDVNVSKEIEIAQEKHKREKEKLWRK